MLSRFFLPPYVRVPFRGLWFGRRYEVWIPGDSFPNLKRIGDIKCPLVVIHGTDDSIIPFAQGKELFELASEPKTFVPVEGADHNDLIGVLGLYEYKKLLLKMANNKQE